MNNERKIRTLSLFSGAGGLDIGFHKAGFDIIGCVEIEPQYCKTLIKNRDDGVYFNPNAEIICQDIRLFDAKHFIKEGIECIIGGPPCQPFSAAGRRSGGVPGIQDERGLLFESYCNVLKILNPKAFIFENVYGLKGANDGEPWREITESFSALGYTISAEILDAADYGVPQHRERLILVGSRVCPFIFPIPTNGPDSSTGKPLVSLWDAVKDIQPTSDCAEPLGGMYGHLLPLVPEGLNYSFFTSEMGYPEPYFAWRSKFHDFLYKADRSKPCRTLKAQPGKFTGPFHWNNRHFSIAELKRIQSFPDNYSIIGTNTQVIAQIGNSVPPRLAEVLAVSVREQLFEFTQTPTYPLRDKGFVSTFRKRQRSMSEYYKAVAQAEIQKRFFLPNSNSLENVEFQNEYYCQYVSRFKSICYSKMPDSKQASLATSVYYITTQCKNQKLSVSMSSKSKTKKRYNGVITMYGLKKYLLKIDNLQMDFNIDSLSELFSVWDTIQKQLVDMSQFYSLIDIYGHYANRGDTVHVQTKFNVDNGNPEIRALTFFGCSDNCGVYLTRTHIATQLNISESSIDKIIVALRSSRYDIRTSATHPTIRTDEIICTYPFPMLSERVLFDKKAKSE